MDGADRSPRSRVGRLATGRRGALVACALVALLVHVGLIGGAGGFDFGPANERIGPPISVRTIAPAPPPPAAAPAAEPAAPMPAPVVPVAVAAPQVKPRPPRAISPPVDGSLSAEKASASLEAAPPPAVVPATVAAEPAPSPDTVAATGSGSGAGGEASPLLAPGEEPPPVYRTQLPPSSTLHYQVRRGLWQGTGEIRWQASAETYRLSLEARIAGLTLLVQSSEGALDAGGLAPVRFVDQRARRPAQAANFRHDIDRISFSGPPVEWPLLAGSQDRLSWMIQLAAIAAAEPGLLVEGGRISMVVVGARGEAAVWTLRCAGREDVQTARGTAHAIKLVREARSISDTGADIWLDPARDYLPARATMKNRDGAAEYELLLDRVEPAS